MAKTKLTDHIQDNHETYTNFQYFNRLNIFTWEWSVLELTTHIFRISQSYYSLSCMRAIFLGNLANPFDQRLSDCSFQKKNKRHLPCLSRNFYPKPQKLPQIKVQKITQIKVPSVHLRKLWDPVYIP